MPTSTQLAEQFKLQHGRAPTNDELLKLISERKGGRSLVVPPTLTSAGGATPTITLEPLPLAAGERDS